MVRNIFHYIIWLAVESHVTTIFSVIYYKQFFYGIQSLIYKICRKANHKAESSKGTGREKRERDRGGHGGIYNGSGKMQNIYKILGY
ncbi:MAG: hypothetical protein HFH61_03285 [Lachnospiraceae bacterium]|jgi:hypothetical protein|nr:hypothetical protein [Lachnospiraceae bacterium]